LLGRLSRRQSGVYKKENWGDDNMLKSADISVNTDKLMPVSENAISKDIDLIMEQDLAKAFQPMHQHAKEIQQQLECNSSILCRLKQKLKEHNIFDDK
jgi:hypothetical protein